MNTRARRRIAFGRIADAALARSAEIAARWCPNGRREGREWVAINPRRASDKHLGNFKINLATGKWSDFASDDRGGDFIALAAYLFGIDMGEAARRVADMLGIDPHE